MYAAIIMAAIAAASAISKSQTARNQRKEADRIKAQEPESKVSQYTRANLGLAQQLYNGDIIGGATLRRGIATTQSNTLANIDRNATNSSQALALASATQGQTNDSLTDLQVREQQAKMGLLGNLNAANSAIAAEEDFKANRKYQSDVMAKTQLRNAAAQNKAGAYSDVIAGVGAVAGAIDYRNSNQLTPSENNIGINSSNINPQTGPMGGYSPTFSQAPAYGSMNQNNMAYPSVYNGPMPNAGSIRQNDMAPYQPQWIPGRTPKFNFVTGRWE